MTTKKEQIINKKIKCYISEDSNIAKIKAGTENFDINLKIKYVEESSKFYILTNYLLKIKKTLSELNSKFDFDENSEIIIVVDNEDILKVIKPDGKIPLKPSKSLKKSIDDIDFKRTLGILLFDFSTFKNIDLVLESSLKNKREVDNMNNNYKNKKDDFNLNIDDKNDNFDLDMDISLFSDIIVSETDSLNYEDELFKNFDFNADSLFKDTTENNNFIFSDEDTNNSSNIASDDIIVEKSNTVKKETEANNELDFNISLDSEDNLDTKNFEKSTNNSFLDSNIIFNDDILIDDDFKVDNIFSSTKNEDIKNNIPTYKSKEDSSEELVNIPVYKSNEDDFLVVDDSKETISDEFITIIDEEVDDNINKIESIENNKHNKVDEHSVDETLVDNKIDTAHLDKINSNEFKLENNIKKENVKNNSSSRNDSKTSIIKKNSVESKSINNEKDSKGGVMMKNDKQDSYSNVDNKEFIKKEMIELRNILKDKSNSYKSKMSKLNIEFEEKHNALKDLNLRDEDEQYKIFKEFLKCKSNMLDLNDLNATCNSIIADIENKISNL